MDAVLRDPFMTGGYMPVRLPLSCLTVAPEFDAVLNAGATVARQPLGDLKNREKNGADQLVGAFKQLEGCTLFILYVEFVLLNFIYFEL